jgi:hypothetical protein
MRVAGEQGRIKDHEEDVFLVLDNEDGGVGRESD